MFTTGWTTSPPVHDVVIEPSVRIPMSDGTELDGALFRPAGDGRHPVILGYHAYPKDKQIDRAFPGAMTGANADAEAGDPLFFARRGFAHAVVNVRGTGDSGGLWNYQGPGEIADGAEVVQWLAAQPWCDGNVGMTGLSYFAIMAKRVASARPPALKAIFSPWGRASNYRQYYPGGVLSVFFLLYWPGTLANLSYESLAREYLGEDERARRIAAALTDPEIAARPGLVGALHGGAEGTGAAAFIADVLIHRFADEPFWTDRETDVERIEVPVVDGADWGGYGVHLQGSLNCYERLGSPRQLLVGPPCNLDRPVYQYAQEQLRWFDHWLKGVDNGVMDQPPVRVFVPGRGDWLSDPEWPLAATRWIPFNLHPDGLLSEHELFSQTATSSFSQGAEDAALTFTTPPLVEATTVVGPALLELFAQTTDDDVIWFASLWDVPPDGEPQLLTRGWLRGSMRAVDPARSRDWEAWHLLSASDPVAPGDVERFVINVIATARHFPPGHRIALKLASSDPERPTNSGEGAGIGRMTRPGPATVTVHHDLDHPSCLHLPIVEGNIVGTYMSGGLAAPHR